ncbi:hypothetical protein N7516_005493 [Penicillium verrucosum]|uniref:uncharacterized protein n=1 Tax=Penicillium verrucosum TaxID=60171 RepID=UPI0025458F8F|nr:uncharacterized protein N7516_005493 [Penicillium verrucosum]KAJ5945325.1 hypothetical protein N7516_005493 [Penicillium verrucosum]
MTSISPRNPSERGGLRLQDNRLTGGNNFKPPSINDPDPPRNPSDRGGLRLQDNRQTGDYHLEYPAP